MKTDGIFDFKSVEIPAKYGEAINLIFLGDIHWNSPGFARKEWENDCDKLKKIKNAYFIKTGDVFEAFSTSERHSFNTGNFHDSNRTRWEREYAREIDEYVKEASFEVGRTLAVFGGNHFFQFYDGTTSDMALAHKLKAPYIGCSGYVILKLKINEHKTHIVKIFVHHGKSSGRKAGSAFNALEEASSYFADADIVVMGHDHKAGAMKISSLNCESGMGGHWKIKSVDRIIGRAGSYLKAYEPGAKSYSVDAMYRPSSLGFLQVVLTPRRKCYGTTGAKNFSEERWVELNAII